ncbi:MAG: NAD(P)H-hydrate epimerase [Candidatus Dormibacteraeota bacterium]|nr:NAD(P)H-hydrate epimerase [Candidatus Dormibacteraeota bacterium]
MSDGLSLQDRYGALTSEQVADLDRASVACGVDVTQLMEVAGFQVARCAWQRLGGQPGDVTVFAGSGNNGGDGAVAACLLATWGCQLRLHALLGDKPLQGLLAQHLKAAAACGVEVMHQRNPAELAHTHADLLIDAVLGTGLHAAPRGLAAAAIRFMGQWGAPVLSVDVPSGLDASSGEAFDPCVAATITCTLGAMKAGLWSTAARRLTGEIVVADIGIPAAAWEACGLTRPVLVAGGELLTVPAATE